MVTDEKKSEKEVKYKIMVDDIHLEFDHPIVTGKEILQKAGKIPTECFSLYQLLKGQDFEKISQNENVDLSKPGIEKFITKPPEVYYYTVDDEPETTDEQQLTANQILVAAGYKPEDYYLVQIKKDGTQISYKDNPEDIITMECPGLKFIALYRSSTPVS